MCVCNVVCVCVCDVGLQVRLTMYRKRKAYLEGMLTAESAKLDSQARFIMEIIEKKLVIGKQIFWLYFSVTTVHFTISRQSGIVYAVA